MESLSGGDAIGPFQDGGGDHGYPVNSSCPSTSRALSIPEIRERIVNLTIPPNDKSSFCNVRAVGRAWKESAFEVIKNLDMDLFQLPLSGDYRLHKTKEFLDKVMPDALFPLVPVFDINRLDFPLSNRLAEDYSHLFVAMHLEINCNYNAISDLDQKLEVFQRRDYSRLQTIKLRVSHNERAPVEEIQKGLDAIERLTGSLTKLRHFCVILSCDVAEEHQLVLPSRTTELSLAGRNFLKILLHPENTLPWLQTLNLFIHDTSGAQTNLRNFLEHHRTLKKLYFCVYPDTQDEPLSLHLPQLESLKHLSVVGNNYVVETSTGTDVLPNLTSAAFSIKLNLDDREVSRLAALGKLLRKATKLSLLVRTSPNASARMKRLSKGFSNVTTLRWISESGWETLVRPLSHVFRRMTALQEIEIEVDMDEGDTPMDLCRLLTGLQESQIPTEEKPSILNRRRNVLTNLRRLKSLVIIPANHFLQPLSPFLFQAVFNSMPELTEIRLCGNSKDAELFINVQDMVTAWRASGKLIR